jgi:hypothetical protein
MVSRMPRTQDTLREQATNVALSAAFAPLHQARVSYPRMGAVNHMHMHSKYSYELQQSRVLAAADSVMGQI